MGNGEFVGKVTAAAGCVIASLFVAAGIASAADSAAPAPAANGSHDWTTAEDHADMMRRLDITELRPGPSGNESDANHANYDEALANPFPKLPDALRMQNGSKVTTAKQWREKRRPEIVELFEHEVLGRVPKDVPKVQWSVVSANDTSKVGPRTVHMRRLVGKVDNSAWPGIEVNIDMVVVLPRITPAGAVMIMFGRGRMPDDPVPVRPVGPPPAAGSAPAAAPVPAPVPRPAAIRRRRSS